MLQSSNDLTYTFQNYLIKSINGIGKSIKVANNGLVSTVIKVTVPKDIRIETIIKNNNNGEKSIAHFLNTRSSYNT